MTSSYRLQCRNSILLVLQSRDHRRQVVPSHPVVESLHNTHLLLANLLAWPQRIPTSQCSAAGALPASCPRQSFLFGLWQAMLTLLKHKKHLVTVWSAHHIKATPSRSCPTGLRDACEYCEQSRIRSISGSKFFQSRTFCALQAVIYEPMRVKRIRCRILALDTAR